MRYRNIKTGAVILTSGEVYGEDWEVIPGPGSANEKVAPVQPESEKPAGKKAAEKKRTVSKKAGE